MQVDWWTKIKTILPGYIQGMDCKQIKQRLLEYYEPGYTSMAADGSGWDSSQYAALAKAGPNKFFSAIREA